MAFGVGDLAHQADRPLVVDPAAQRPGNDKTVMRLGHQVLKVFAIGDGRGLGRQLTRCIHDVTALIGHKQCVELRQPVRAGGQQQVYRQTVQRELPSVRRVQALLHAQQYQIHGVEVLLGLLHEHARDALGFELTMPQFTFAQVEQ